MLLHGCLSLPGRAGKRAPASRKLQDVCPRREIPPLPLRERCHGAAAEVLFFGGKFGIKQGMRGELVIKIGLGVSVRVDGKPRLKCVDCLFPPPHTHNLIKVCAHGTSGAVES